MRSQTDYIVTKEEVHGYADHWLGSSLKLDTKAPNALPARYNKFS